jgi:hypothetical protein
MFSMGVSRHQGFAAGRKRGQALAQVEDEHREDWRQLGCGVCGTAG